MLHFGDHNLRAGVRPAVEGEAYETLVAELSAAFELGDFASVLRSLDEHFGEPAYSLQSLFRDPQRQVLDQLLASTHEELEREYREIYELHAPLMRFLAGLGQPLPAGFRAAAELVVNADLRRAIADAGADPEEVEQRLREAAAWRLDLDRAGLGLALAWAVQRRVELLRESPDDDLLLRELERAVALAHSVPFPVDLAEAQTAFYRFVEDAWAGRAAAAGAGDETAAAWVASVAALGEALRVRVR